MFILGIEDQDGNIIDEYTFEDGEFTVGRSRGCHVILPSDNVSRQHAEIFTRAGQLFVRDLGSSNGVLIDGRRVRNEESLGNQTKICIGDFKIHIDRVEDEEETTDSSSIPLGIQLKGQNLGVAGRAYNIDQEVNLLGRGRDCSTTVIDPSVSRVHAKISWDSEGVLWAEDLKSANGTFLNGIRIEKSAISEGDLLRIGNVEFTLETRSEDSVLKPPRPEQTASGMRQAAQTDSKAWLHFTVAGIAAALLISGLALFGSSLCEPNSESAEGEQEGERNATPASVPVQPSPVVPSGPSTKELLKIGNDALKERDWDKAQSTFSALRDKDPLSKNYIESEQKAILEATNAKSLSGGLKDLERSLYGDAMKAFREITEESEYRERADAEIKNLLAKKKKLLSRAKKDCRRRKYQSCVNNYTTALSIDPSDKAVQKKREAALKKLR